LTRLGYEKKVSSVMVKFKPKQTTTPQIIEHKKTMTQLGTVIKMWQS